MPALPASLINALRDGVVAPFVGAGVSRAVTDAAGEPLFPSWRKFLIAAVDKLQAEGQTVKANRVRATLEDDDYLDAARVAREALGSRWYKLLQEQFDQTLERAHEPSLSLARAVWRLGSPLVVTTNYDNVLRWACPDPRRVRHWMPSTAAGFVEVARNQIEHPTIWHLHGHVDRPEEIILSPSEYERFYEGGYHKAALQSLRILLASKTLLFIGFGMEGAIREQIAWVRETYEGAGGQHFVLVRACERAAMEEHLKGLSVQPVEFADFGAPQIALLEELARHADMGGLPRTLAPRVDADPRPYLEYLRSDTAFIEIRGLRLNVAQAPRFPIHDLYIPLIDEQGRRGEMTGVEPSRRLLEDSLDQARLVILGDPGSGKTTFLRRLANNACKARLANAEAPFPLLVRVSELAEFAASAPRKDAPALLPKLLARETRELVVPLDEHFFERQLTEGPCLLLVDGLDEAPNAEDRAAVSRLLERAAHAWQNCRFVVTTRPKAYEEEVMLAGFEEARIGPLEPKDIRTFLERWSAALMPESAERARVHAQTLIRAVESRAEIRRHATNPVMLTALAVLHWNEKRMPEQRADLYDSILNWLARSREGRPGRLSPENCIKVLQELAWEMQRHAAGRQVQVSREWAAELVAPQFQGDSEEALAFLEAEEKDSGIVVNRGADVKFSHLTFQEFLAARLLASLDASDRHALLFGRGTAWLPEWREVVLLLAGILHQQRSANVDALVTAALNDLYGSFGNRLRQWIGGKPKLADQTRCFSLLDAMLRDLQPLGYVPSDPRYAEVKNAVVGVFLPEAADIPLAARLATAEAIGRAGDPRLRVPSDADYWVAVDNFLIGRYPVTVFEYARFVEAGGAQPNNWDQQLQRPNCPVVYVSWHDAQAYCKWAGVRLPTEREWERAARGEEGHEYPWGSEPPGPERANYDETRLGRVSPVGLFPRGSTPEGIADMAGNVWEWVEDWYDDNQEHRVVRGGSWVLDDTYLRAAYRYRDLPVNGYDLYGFRCVREVFS